MEPSTLGPGRRGWADVAGQAPSLIYKYPAHRYSSSLILRRDRTCSSLSSKGRASSSPSSFRAGFQALTQFKREFHALTNIGLGVDEVDGSGVNMETEGIVGGDGDAAGQQLGGAIEEGRVDIPLHDEAVDE
ncbi:hypothetical protein Dimus_026638 [Dionaea muscipula]